MKERLLREQKDFCREHEIKIPRCWLKTSSNQKVIKKISSVYQTYQSLKRNRKKLLEKREELLNFNETLEKPRKCVALKWKLEDVMNLSNLDFSDLDSVVKQLEDMMKEYKQKVDLLNDEHSMIVYEKKSQENREDLRRQLKYFLDSRPKEDSTCLVFIATEYKSSPELLKEFYKRAKKEVKRKAIVSNGSRVIFDPTRVSIEEVAEKVSCSDKVKIIRTFNEDIEKIDIS